MFYTLITQACYVFILHEYTESVNRGKGRKSEISLHTPFSWTRFIQIAAFTNIAEIVKMNLQ